MQRIRLAVPRGQPPAPSGMLTVRCPGQTGSPMSDPTLPPTTGPARPQPAGDATRTGDATAAGPPADAAPTYLDPPRQPEEIGRLAHYRVLKPLGAGGMGQVFLAEDTLLVRRV